MKPFINLDSLEIPEDIPLIGEQGDISEIPSVTDELLQELGLDQPQPLQILCPPPPTETSVEVPVSSSKRKGKSVATSPSRAAKRPTPAMPRRFMRSQSVTSQTPATTSSFLNMAEGDSMKYLELLSTDTDRLALKDKPLTGLCDTLASHLLASTAILETIAHREDPIRLRTIADEQSKELRRLRAELKDSRVPQANQEMLEELTARVATLEKALQEKEELLINVQREKENLQGEITQREKTAYQQGRTKCVEDFRDFFLKSSMGQTLLEDMRCNLLSAYMRSKEYFERMSVPCGTYFKIGFQYALKQMQKQGFAGSLESPPNVKLSPSLVRWEGDLNEEASFPWWQAVNEDLVNTFTKMDTQKIEDVLQVPSLEK